MNVRRLDKNHDWTFGQGLNNYATESEAIAQNVQTRLWSFTNDWFLDLEHGLPWLEQMGRSVSYATLETLIKRTVLETEGVSEITDYQYVLDKETRALTVSIAYIDIYGNESSTNYTTRE